MLIAPDDKRPSDAKMQPDGDPVGPEEPPPSYSPPTDAVAGPSVAFKTKPTNFLVLANEQDNIRGEFVVDPCLTVPSSVLPPLGEGETEDDRKNLSLTSTYGSVQAEIWLLGSAIAHKPRRTTVALTSNHGSIRAQVRTLPGAAPFSLTASATHGTIRLEIPQSFQGLLSLSTRHGSITLSDALVRNATQLSQVDTTRRYFIGDFHVLGEDEWQGDQMELDAVHGHVRIKYVDEAADAQEKKGLFGWLLKK